MDKERDPPAVALHLYLGENQRKAVQDVLDPLGVQTEDEMAPVYVTKDKSLIHSVRQTNKGELKQQRMSKVQPDMMLTPSISTTLFFLNTDLKMSELELGPQMFARSPWKFHHLTEVNTRKQSTNRIHARQEFYELSPDLPLFTASSTHFGKQMLRITIATYNHADMINFYKILFAQPGVCVRSDFTYFTFSYSKELTLQFALKSAAGLMPYPTDSTDLFLTLDMLPNGVKSSQVVDNLHLVTDPDENCLLLRISAKCNLVQHSSNCKLSDLVSSNEKLAFSLSNRPDVVPSQDCYIASTQVESLALEQKTLSTRRFRSTPPIAEKNLTPRSQTPTSGSSDHMSDRNNNSKHRRRPSIDVLESF